MQWLFTKHTPARRPHCAKHGSPCWTAVACLAGGASFVPSPSRAREQRHGSCFARGLGLWHVLEPFKEAMRRAFIQPKESKRWLVGSPTASGAAANRKARFLRRLSNLSQAMSEGSHASVLKCRYVTRPACSWGTFAFTTQKQKQNTIHSVCFFWNIWSPAHKTDHQAKQQR